MKDSPAFICPVSDLVSAVLKLTQAIKNKKSNDNLDSKDTSLFCLNIKFMTKTPVNKINNKALVDLASLEKKGVG